MRYPRQDAVESLADSLARGTLRASIASSRSFAIVLIAASLAGSWLVVYISGGADSMVPHWYYIPILFAAVRFGAYAAFPVALLAGVIAGPLTFENVAMATAQEPARWLTRAGFFVGIGLLMAWLAGPSLRSVAEEVRTLRQEYDIRRGLANGEFVMVYQPILSIGSRRCVGFEALIRWQHRSRGLLSPAFFMEVAERSSLIHEISDFVVDEACRKVAEWNALAEQNHKDPLHVAINLSGRDLEQPDLADKILLSLARHDAAPEHLHIELTESVLALSGSESQLHRLRQKGIQLHIDDFGTGYSSLSYLNRFTVDFIKVDRSLIADLATDEHSQTLADCIVTLARKFGLRTVAEGIETEDQLAMAGRVGFDLAQGFLLSRPLPGDAIPGVILEGLHSDASGQGATG